MFWCILRDLQPSPQHTVENHDDDVGIYQDIPDCPQYTGKSTTRVSYTLRRSGSINYIVIARWATC